MNDKIKTLDLRAMPPAERHRKIFETWNSLDSGETLSEWGQTLISEWNRGQTLICDFRGTQ